VAKFSVLVFLDHDTYNFALTGLTLAVVMASKWGPNR